MQTNMFGEYKPKDSGELSEAIELTNMDPTTASVIVDKEDGKFFAEIMDDNDRSFTLGPYDSKDVLKQDLVAADFEYISDGF